MDAESDITEVEAFMREYNDLFTSGDAKALWSRVYRFEPGGKAMINSEADLKKLHDDIVAQGYSHSIVHMMKVTPTGPDLMRVNLHFERKKTDGSTFAPGKQASEYNVQKFPDGWRITSAWMTTLD